MSNGRIAILGATGSVGTALAQRLSKQSRGLLLLGRDEQKLAALASALGQSWGMVDASDSQTLEKVVSEDAAANGPLGAMVNCIGSILLKPAHSTSDEEFRDVIEANLFSAFSAVKVGAKLLRQSGGSIILFASAAAEIGIHNHEAIAAAKAGVIGLGRSAAATYASSNIRVNVISPGLVRSNMTRRIWENDAASAASTKLHALGRLGEPMQIASLAAWLLDEENDWITGQVIGVDGGLGHLLPRK